ncbi:MAG: porin [Pseudomonadota bacterium]
MFKQFQGVSVGGMLVLASSMVAAQTTADPAKSQVVIFGAANVQFESIQATGSVNPAEDKPVRQRLSNVSSDLGIKRSFDLTDGLAAHMQYVTGVSVDNAAGSTSAGMFGSAKDSFVGLSKEGVGMLKLGRLSGAARWNSGTTDFSSAGAGPQDLQGPQSLIGGLTGVAPLFNVRLDNAIGFESAAWNGLSVRAYYSANEGRSNAVPTSGSALSDDSVSLGARYVAGPFDVRLSAEQRNDKGTLNNTTNRNTQDKDYKIGVRFALQPNTTIALGWDTMSFSDNAATGTQKTKLSRDGWVLSFNHQIDKHVIYGGYGVANDATGEQASGTFDGRSTGASQVTLAYKYLLNKHIILDAFMSQVQNKSRAKYDFDSGGISPGTGATLTAVGAGLRIVF